MDDGVRRRLLTTVAAVLGVALLVAPASGVASASPSPSASADASGSVRVEAAADADVRDAAAAQVAAMTLEQKAASVVMGHVPTKDVDDLRAYMSTSGIGGFILMGSNVPGREAALRRITQALTIDPAFPPLIAIDEEGGDVTRLPWDRLPSALTLKASAPEAARDAFLARGALVQRAGIGVNFGLVADVPEDSGGFIHRRALGTSPEGAAARVTAALEGERGQALSTLKHFPGHGAASGDSHALIPTTSLSLADWRVTDAVPFAAGLDAGAPILMFGHLRYSAVDRAPASLSAKWHAIARDELGFTGVSITDDLGMLEATGNAAYDDPVKNAVAAIAAGNDMVLSIMFTTARSAPRTAAGIAAAVREGTLPQARLDEAATRVAELRLVTAAAGRGLVPCTDCAPVG